MSNLSARVTPQIEAQVDAILNQWFGSEQPQIDTTSGCPQIPSSNNECDGNYWEPQPATIPTAPETTISTDRPNNLIGRIW